MQAERKRKLLEKPLHSQFFKATTNVREHRTWSWLCRGQLKKETEGLITAAQDQALRTNSIKAYIDEQNIPPTCRLCGVREETVSHIVAECKMLLQKHYHLWRHDKVAAVIHWKLCERKWYDHKPWPVLESEAVKLLWDFKIQTDHRQQTRYSVLLFLISSQDHVS